MDNKIEVLIKKSLEYYDKQNYKNMENISNIDNNYEYTALLI